MRRLKNWLRRLVIAAAACSGMIGAAHAQCTFDQQVKFDTVYWASQPPAIRSAFSGPVPSLAVQQARAVSAAQLASQGYVVDVPIMVYGFDPCQEMAQRLSFGLTWVPSALQNGLGQPGGFALPGVPTQPGQTPYDANKPPAGSVKVSVSLQDYPPFDPPAPPPSSSAPADPVGGLNFGNIYLTAPGDQAPDGATVTNSRGTFTKHVALTPFGRNSWWEKTN